MAFHSLIDLHQVTQCQVAVDVNLFKKVECAPCEPVDEAEPHIHICQVGVAGLILQAAGHGQHFWRAAAEANRR